MLRRQVRRKRPGRILEGNGQNKGEVPVAARGGRGQKYFRSVDMGELVTLAHVIRLPQNYGNERTPLRFAPF